MKTYLNIKEKIGEAIKEDSRLDDKKKELIKERDKNSEIKKLKAKEQEKSDPKTQDEIKQNEQEHKKDKEKHKKNQKIIYQKNRPEVIKGHAKVQIAQERIEEPIEEQKDAVMRRIVDAIQSSIASTTDHITNSRMNTEQSDTITFQSENNPVAAGSQIFDARITPKSWDIWASGYMGNVNQGAATSDTSQTSFYCGSIGIDKIFDNNSIFGLALSYGKSNTEYKSQRITGATSNVKWASNYYQTDIYAHYNFTDRLFAQLIGGIGTYGDGTTIGNMFDFSSQKSTLGYHGNATVGYSIFSGEDSNFAVTPQLGIAYYHLNTPDFIFGKTNSSTFTTLGRFDCIAGVNIKIFNLNSNVKISPEITVAFKLRLSDNVKGINADNVKLPVVKNTNSNDLSANALAAPEQLFTLGGALTAVTNNNLSVSINGSADFAKQYFAMVGGISVKLSF